MEPRLSIEDIRRELDSLCESHAEAIDRLERLINQLDDRWEIVPDWEEYDAPEGS